MVNATCMRNCLVRNYLPSMLIENIVSAALQATSESDFKSRIQKMGLTPTQIERAVQCYGPCNR